MEDAATVVRGGENSNCPGGTARLSSPPCPRTMTASARASTTRSSIGGVRKCVVSPTYTLTRPRRPRCPARSRGRRSAPSSARSGSSIMCLLTSTRRSSQVQKQVGNRVKVRRRSRGFVEPPQGHRCSTSEYVRTYVSTDCTTTNIFRPLPAGPATCSERPGQPDPASWALRRQRLRVATGSSSCTAATFIDNPSTAERRSNGTSAVRAPQPQALALPPGAR